MLLRITGWEFSTIVPILMDISILVVEAREASNQPFLFLVFLINPHSFLCYPFSRIRQNLAQTGKHCQSTLNNRVNNLAHVKLYNNKRAKFYRHRNIPSIILKVCIFAIIHRTWLFYYFINGFHEREEVRIMSFHSIIVFDLRLFTVYLSEFWLESALKKNTVATNYAVL